MTLTAAACGLISPIEPLPDPDVRSGCLERDTLCDGSCFDTDNDPSHCGGCETTCGPQQFCLAGQCYCLDGAALCDGVCVDTQQSLDHCGDCETVCGSRETCVDGVCEDNGTGGSSGGRSTGGTGSGGGGQGGSGGAEAGGGNGGSDDTTCTPEFVADIANTRDPKATTLVDVRGSSGLGIQARENPVLVPLDPDHYRAIALSVRNEFVYADVEHSPADPGGAGFPDWKRIGYDYFFSPPAVVATSNQMWVFGVGPEHQLYRLVQVTPSDGSWGTSLIDIELDDGVTASKTAASNNVVIAGRCLDHRACVAVQPVVALDQLSGMDFLRLPVESSFQPAAVESADGVHVAITGKDGIIRHALGTVGDDSRWDEEDFAWTELAGVCFESAPSLLSGQTSVDVFARGTDGALYWQSIGESAGWTRLSEPVASGPLVLYDGGGTLVFAMTDGYQPMMRRLVNGFWTGWTIFDMTAVPNAPEQPFPGAALPVGREQVRLVMRYHASYLVQFSFGPP